MQIKCLVNYGWKVTLICVFFTTLGCIRNKSIAQENVDHRTATQKLNYAIVGDNCTRKKECYLFLYVENTRLNKDDLLRIVENIKEMNPKRKFLRTVFFDDMRVPEQYLSSKREIREIKNDLVAMYTFDKNSSFPEKCEALKLGRKCEYLEIKNGEQLEVVYSMKID
jgi:hypothetical protein